MPARRVKVETANTLMRGGELQPLIPQEYHDLAEVFSEKESDMLPSHRLQN